MIVHNKGKNNQYSVSLPLEKIPEILERLGIQYSFSKNRYFFSCPVHGGDNKSGCTIFSDEKLCWKCWTHGCHEEYGSGIFGFIRGVLSRRNSRNASYNEVAEFIGSKYCYLDDGTESIPSQLIDYKRIQTKFTIEPNREYKYNIDREYVIKNLEIPSPYFLSRGLSKEVLNKFDVGDCKEGYMAGRAVSPIYNEDYRFVGNGGRIIEDKEDLLRSYKSDVDPSLINYPNSKWIYDSIIEKGEHLYGLNLSKQYILDTGYCIVVEGQGNVWKLWDAGFYYSAGTMGSTLTDSQLILLEKSGCVNIVIMTDMDEAGRKCCLKIQEMGGRRFNYMVPEMEKNDPEEHTVEELTEILTSLGIKK